MTGFLLAFVLITIVIMVVIESVTVRFIYKSELIIRIDFLLIELILYPSRKRKRRRNKGNIFTGIKKGFARAAATKKALEHLLSHSRITVSELNVMGKTDDPAKLALSTQRANSLISAIITYLSLKTVSVTAGYNAFDTANENFDSVTIDVSLASTLFNVVSALAIFILNANRYKRKRGRGIV